MSWKQYTAEGRLKDKGGLVPLTGVVFRAYRGAAQNAASGDVIHYDAKDFDPFVWYDAATWRFAPKIAGYYHVDAAIGPSVVMTTDKYAYMMLRKNGANHTRGDISYERGASTQITVSGLVYLNGKTDYIDCIFVHNNGGTVALAADGGFSFSASLVAASTGVAPEPWHVLGAPGEPALVSSWTQQSPTETVAFFKDPDGMVHLKGRLQALTTPTALAFTLPAGYRPGNGNMTFPLNYWNGSARVLGSIMLANNGQVALYGNTDNATTMTYAQIEVVHFRAEL